MHGKMYILTQPTYDNTFPENYTESRFFLTLWSYEIIDIITSI